MDDRDLHEMLQKLRKARVLLPRLDTLGAALQAGQVELAGMMLTLTRGQSAQAQVAFDDMAGEVEALLGGVVENIGVPGTADPKTIAQVQQSPYQAAQMLNSTTDQITTSVGAVETVKQPGGSYRYIFEAADQQHLANVVTTVKEGVDILLAVIKTRPSPG